MKENAYLAILSEGLGKAMPVLPYVVFLLVFVLALKVLEAKFGRRKRGRWQRSSRWEQGKDQRARMFALD